MEQWILLSVRHGGDVLTAPAQAANWANYWRHEVEGYIAAYKAVKDADTLEPVLQPGESRTSRRPSLGTPPTASQ